MKIIEVLHGFPTAITNEEAELLGKFNDNVKVSKVNLEEREQHLANQLVVKGVLVRKHHDGQIQYYKPK